MGVKRPFCSYEVASAWGRAQNFRTGQDWTTRAKQPGWPKSIPKNPSGIYPEFYERGGWGGFLGTGNVATKNRKLESYAVTSEWAREQRISTSSMWHQRRKESGFPRHIPKRPDNYYPDFHERGGWNAFLGTPILRQASKTERILKNGLQRALSLDSSTRTIIIDGSGKVAVDMADRARKIIVEYDGSRWHGPIKNMERDREKTRRLTAAGWSVIRVREVPLEALDHVMDVVVQKPYSMADGYATMIHAVLNHMLRLVEIGALKDEGLKARIESALNERFDERDVYDILTLGHAPYEVASGWAKQEGLSSQSKWVARRNQPNWPQGIPCQPNKAYPDFYERGGWGAFLGTGTVAPQHRSFLAYEGVSAWAQEKGFLSGREYQRFCKENKIPSNIPKAPNIFFNDFVERGGWWAFLGKKGPKPRAAVQQGNGPFRSYEDARAWALPQSIPSRRGWQARTTRADFPDDIPVNPDQFYPGFTARGGWAAFLGNAREPKQGRKPVQTNIIRLGKPGEEADQSTASNDESFVMPMAS